jgi:hypothetical protein
MRAYARVLSRLPFDFDRVCIFADAAFVVVWM